MTAVIVAIAAAAAVGGDAMGDAMAAATASAVKAVVTEAKVVSNALVKRVAKAAVVARSGTAIARPATKACAPKPSM